MARKRMTTAERTRVRVELNRKAFEAIDLATADGLFELAKEVITSARVPDAPPYGVGLHERGGVISYVGRSLVGSFGGEGRPDPTPGWAATSYLHAALAEGTKGRRGRRPRQSVAKPRDARLDSSKISVFAGYGFPARFVEIGTLKTSAHPFLTPALQAKLPEAHGFVKLAYEKAKIISATRKAVGDVFKGTPSVEDKRTVGRVRGILRRV